MRLIDYRVSNVPISRVKQLLSYAVGAPKDEKLKRILDKVYADANAILYTCMENGDTALGVVGCQRTGESSVEILHIAVDKRKRNQGIGRKIIDELLALEKLTELTAETDAEAVDFYRKYGFSIHALGEKYLGVERFLCRFKQPVY
ncbi:GNAT family N-acetyltransferase [Alicyclobacillus fastidiosus]|uniref:GNAT family N-acetyltransferase n=1 Tax=Alicyclobacillus fastidiosus TaxID=392011 RepID=A0ABY6ZKI9_9BACL|nr:GNAT family N-acetyltransferase [Alicyclobacillus fastidiosus]WAH43381.1 GNAT family N-acetyltransferase [Alicyclobacillus fastidiosus]GMA65444.1 hypothetical protein GCM10025859_58840 [Alicyclobacillus fastidiosus]